MQLKKLIAVVGSIGLMLAAGVPAAQAADLSPNNTIGGGGGGCSVSVSGSADVQSYTGHITNSCGYGVRIWISCVFVFDGMFDRSTKYSSSTLAPTATKKVSCDITDSVTGYGWQYNAGHGWIAG